MEGRDEEGDVASAGASGARGLRHMDSLAQGRAIEAQRLRSKDAVRVVAGAPTYVVVKRRWLTEMVSQLKKDGGGDGAPDALSRSSTLARTVRFMEEATVAAPGRVRAQ